MICDNCGKEFSIGNDQHGNPNGVKMILAGGDSITMCSDCIMNIGTMDDDQRKAFFKELRERAH